eukprot:scaffold283048_cov31-Prasinocladus_malaysianus.AAC.1
MSYCLIDDLDGPYAGTLRANVRKYHCVFIKLLDCAFEGACLRDEILAEGSANKYGMWRGRQQQEKGGKGAEAPRMYNLPASLTQNSRHLAEAATDQTPNKAEVVFSDLTNCIFDVFLSSADIANGNYFTSLPIFYSVHNVMYVIY